MVVTRTALPEVLILESRVFTDERGFFLESYNRRTLLNAAGIDAEFVQDNHTRSANNVLRGLHYQLTQPQGKLVRVTQGAIYDVVVDVRRSSPNFGKYVSHHLSSLEQKLLWIPPGFAHGFLVLSDSADVLYKATDYYAPAHERCLLWSDPALAIPWPLNGEPTVSKKDAEGQRLAAAETFP